MENLETNNIHPKPFWLLQVTHSICALGLGSLCFTLAFPSLSIFQIPINFYIHKKYYQKIGFIKYMSIIQGINVLLFLLLICLVSIFGREPFSLFFDWN
jgi:hypothetical protein